MPEGPEIRRAADQVERAIARQPLTEIFFAFEHLKPYETKLVTQEIRGVETKGKGMLIRFAQGLNIYSHNQLYGQWMVRRAQDYPPTNRQLRLAIHTAQKSALLYSASDIEVLADAELATHSFWGRVGPDVLNPETTPEQVRDRLLAPEFRQRRLTTLLLDQHFLAGLGNYLRSEVLFVARVHPARRPLDCTPDQMARLAEGAIALPRQSYETGGITNDLALAQSLKAAGQPRRLYRHWVFGRDGQPCFVCETPIEKIDAGGRRCYYCPQCQSA